MTLTTITDRGEFASRTYRFDWSLDKLVLPCGPDRGCDFAACAGWRTEYEYAAYEQYTTAEIEEARAFRDAYLAERNVRAPSCPVCGPDQTLTPSGDGWFCAGLDSCTCFFTNGDLGRGDS